MGCTSIRLAVFVGVGVFEDTEVGCVARLRNKPLFQGFDYGAMWLMGVGAVVEATVGSDFKYFRKEVRCFIFVHFNRAKAPDSGSVNDITVFVARQLEHFGECGGVRASVVHF